MVIFYLKNLKFVHYTKIEGVRREYKGELCRNLLLAKSQQVTPLGLLTSVSLET